MRGATKWFLCWYSQIFFVIPIHAGSSGCFCVSSNPPVSIWSIPRCHFHAVESLWFADTSHLLFQLDLSSRIWSAACLKQCEPSRNLPTIYSRPWNGFRSSVGSLPALLLDSSARHSTPTFYPMLKPVKFLYFGQEWWISLTCLKTKCLWSFVGCPWKDPITEVDTE